MTRNVETTPHGLTRFAEPVAIIAICVYAVVFFGQPMVHTSDMPRWTFVFVWLLRPESLVAEWVGNDWTRFGFLNRVPVLLAVTIIFGFSYLAGRLAIDGLRLRSALSRLEVFVFALGIGTNLLSLFTLLVGLCGQLHRLPFGVCFAAISVAAVLRWPAWRQAWKTDSPAESRGRFVQGLIAICIPFAVILLLGGMLPPWHFDVREYHLQVPKEWYQQGSVSFMPHNVYGNMPLGAEMHAMLSMSLLGGWWLGGIAGKTAIALFAPLTSLALYAFGKRLFSPTAGAVAACAYLTTPWTARVSMIGLIEGPYAFYLLLAVYAAWLAVTGRQSEESDSTGRRHLQLVAAAGFFAGAAVACKYPALLFIVAPLGVAITFLPTRKLQWKPAAAFTLAVACSCGPWLVKNYVLTGNPTYPLLYSVFGGETRTPAKDAQWTRAHQTPQGGLTAGHALDSLKLITLTSEYLSPLLVPLAAVGLLRHRRSPVILSLAALTGFIVVSWWLLTHRIDRFLFPLVPLTAVLVGGSVDAFATKSWRGLLVGLVVVCSVCNFLLCASRVVSDNRYFVSLADLRLDLPNAKDPPQAEAPRYVHSDGMHRFINMIVSPGYQVLAVGEAQVFDFEVPIIYNTCFDDCVLETAFRDCPADKRADLFRARRISHVFITWRELERYRRPGNYGYSDYATRERIQSEFVEAGLLREIPVSEDPHASQVFEVVGWEDW